MQSAAGRVILVLFWVSIVAGIAGAGSVIWSYDLTGLPPNWSDYLVSFTEWGANLYLDESFIPNRTAKPDRTCYLLSEYTIIPPGLDSLVIDAPQQVYLIASSWSSTTTASAKLIMYVNETDSLTLWSRLASDFGVVTYEIVRDTMPIHAVVTDLNAGDIVRFEFRGHVGGYAGHATVDWWLYSAQLTAWGELSLVPRTWASIKASW